MIKKLILICSLWVFAWPAQADVKENVHAYLQSYQLLINTLNTVPPPSSRVRVGDSGKLIRNPALVHMSEVIDLIRQGKLDECCFHSPPAKYKQYANATTAEVLAGAAIPNPGTGKLFHIPPYLGTQMKELIEQIVIVTTFLDPTEKGLDFLDTHSLEIMAALIRGPVSADNIFANLVWGWSYIDLAHSSLSDLFKNYYIYGCIVCDGAGFYNTGDLSKINPETGKSYYEEIVTVRNLPRSYAWLQSLAREQGEHPPLQPSIGLTLQGQEQRTERTLSDGVIYPTHCHRAEELYFGLDPMQVSKAAGSVILEGQNGYNYNTDSYGIGAINFLNLPIKFTSNLGPEFPQNFMTVKNADLIYNESLAYHAFNAGRRFQFTQWSRLTWPQEGTYFPLNGGPQPPPGVTCSAKPSLVENNRR